MKTFIPITLTFITLSQARFNQEQIPIKAISDVQGGQPGEASTIAGAAISDLLGAANACAKLQRGDEILTKLGTGADAVAAARGMVAAEKNFNNFTSTQPTICSDASLPQNALLRGITPLIDPNVQGAEVANTLSKQSLAQPLNADGKSIADLLTEAGFTNFISQAAQGGAQQNNAVNNQGNAGNTQTPPPAAGTGNDTIVTPPTPPGSQASCVCPPPPVCGAPTPPEQLGVGANGTAPDAGKGKGDKKKDKNQQNAADDKKDKSKDNGMGQGKTKDDKDKQKQQADNAGMGKDKNNQQQSNNAGMGKDGQNQQMGNMQGNNMNQGNGSAGQKQQDGGMKNGQNGNQQMGNNAGMNQQNGGNKGQQQNGNQQMGNNAGMNNNNGNQQMGNNAGNNTGDQNGNANNGAAATGGANFGSCDPTMSFEAGRAGRKATEFTFQSNDPVIAANQQDALNPNIITNRICDELTNICNANAAAKTICLDAKAQILALGTRDQTTADAWNKLVGGGAGARKLKHRRAVTFRH